MRMEMAGFAGLSCDGSPTKPRSFKMHCTSILAVLLAVGRGSRINFPTGQLHLRPDPPQAELPSSITDLRLTAMIYWPPGHLLLSTPIAVSERQGLITRVSKLVWKTSANYKVVPIVDESRDPHVVISKDQAVQGVVA